jgi:GntR family transcriptional regulator/MocR family aminotransferase
MRIEPGAEAAIYRQIVEQVAARIRDGVYPPGYRLPTTRDLARELGVHRNTVVRAFDEMSQAGLVNTVVGSGTYVAEDAPVNAPVAAPQRPALPWSMLFSNAASAEPLTRYERLVRTVGDGEYINLSRLHPSADLVPVEQIRRCADFVLRRYGDAALGYGPPDGLPRLREHISREMWRAGIPVAADDILITTGSQQALDLVARALCNPGDLVLMEEHSYAGAINAFAAAGARLAAIPCDEQGPSVVALQQMLAGGVKALYLMPNCSNPTGRSISVARRRELVDWSHRAGVPVIEDDYGADLDETLAPPALRSLDADVIYLGTFSKKLVPALRVGYLVAPHAASVRLAALKQGMDLGTSLLHQYILAEFIERGYLRTHLRHIQPVYRTRREALAEALRRALPSEIAVREPEFGVVFWINLPAGIDPDLLFHEALKEGVVVSPGSFHSIHPQATAGIRLTFCSEPEERLREGAVRLGRAFASVRARLNRMKRIPSTPSIDGV